MLNKESVEKEVLRVKGIFSCDLSGIGGVMFQAVPPSENLLLSDITGGENKLDVYCDGGCRLLARGVVSLFSCGCDSPDLDSESVGKT